MIAFLYVKFIDDGERKGNMFDKERVIIGYALRQVVKV